MKHSSELAYIVGVALGDGNLSCPNGRAIRLRITCDLNYPNLIDEIILTLEKIFPDNKVSRVKRRDKCLDISIYSNKLSDIMPWTVGRGSKHHQDASVPSWIKNDLNYTRCCLRGLIQTDGSIYKDREYTMINFSNVTEKLCDDVYKMIVSLSYKPHKYKTLQKTGNHKHTVRLSKEVAEFIKEIDLMNYPAAS